MSRVRFRARNQTIAAHYSELARRYGDSPRAAQWRGARSQERRFDILFGIGDLSAAKILDFGCGLGPLYEALRRRFAFAGEYVGYDLSEGMLRIARAKFPEARFESVDIFAEDRGETFDYVFVSGTFNNEHADAHEFLRAAVPRLFALCRKGMAFNALSAFNERRVADLIYVDPLELFEWARHEITPLVALRHDYCIDNEEPPEDFTLYLRRPNFG